jgi:hypothetical protein
MYQYKTEIPPGGWGPRGRDLAAVRRAFEQCFGSFQAKEAARPPLDFHVL